MRVYLFIGATQVESNKSADSFPSWPIFFVSGVCFALFVSLIVNIIIHIICIRKKNLLLVIFAYSFVFAIASVPNVYAIIDAFFIHVIFDKFAIQTAFLIMLWSAMFIPFIVLFVKHCRIYKKPLIEASD